MNSRKSSAADLPGSVEDRQLRFHTKMHNDGWASKGCAATCAACACETVVITDQEEVNLTQNSQLKNTNKKSHSQPLIPSNPANPTTGDDPQDEVGVIRCGLFPKSANRVACDHHFFDMCPKKSAPRKVCRPSGGVHPPGRM